MATRDPDSEDAGEDANADLGGLYFAFVESDDPAERLNLRDRGLEFQDGQPAPRIGKRAFGQGITALTQALNDYAKVLEAHEGVLAELLETSDTDPLVLGASDRVHEELFRLQVGHQAYTGRPFLHDPLVRGAHGYPQPQGPVDDHDEVDDEAHADGNDDDGPSARELGSSVPLNLLLQSGNGTMARLDVATVYGNGVMLGVDCVQLRGQHEDAGFWRLRSRGTVGVELEAHDPGAGTAYSMEPQELRRDGFSKAVRHRGEMWMPGVLEAQQLSCTLHVGYMPNIHGDETPLELDFDLDTGILRTAAKGIQRPDDEA